MLRYMLSNNHIITHDLPEYRLDAVTTELKRTHGEQGRKLDTYVWHMGKVKWIKKQGVGWTVEELRNLFYKFIL